jgi:natural product precursor
LHKKINFIKMKKLSRDEMKLLKGGDEFLDPAEGADAGFCKKTSAECTVAGMKCCDNGACLPSSPGSSSNICFKPCN